MPFELQIKEQKNVLEAGTEEDGTYLPHTMLYIYKKKKQPNLKHFPLLAQAPTQVQIISTIIIRHHVLYVQ